MLSCSSLTNISFSPSPHWFHLVSGDLTAANLVSSQRRHDSTPEVSVPNALQSSAQLLWYDAVLSSDTRFVIPLSSAFLFLPILTLIVHILGLALFQQNPTGFFWFPTLSSLS
ncbi:hypothetical protein P175DRAFT_0497321 [Aspergillus ochraceoroseus IBT 24754]|uniref:Uncharacterized protein n=1 Tax=Aspergillus ochraceoroseus IBT 24754 TaxID=1392256 RepID=A0A2T5M6Q7_9EURO|nr:uncharacterized protein P175DRAFT_0497321 [Aspergillus ochraceoroseus IBT 24754]PTU24209.1 hypothetical protein P175DRAFT_0497321 [Aspergillus ochraceoroseus IBT 24754]